MIRQRLQRQLYQLFPEQERINKVEKIKIKNNRVPYHGIHVNFKRRAKSKVSLLASKKGTSNSSSHIIIWTATL